MAMGQTAPAKPPSAHPQAILLLCVVAMTLALGLYSYSLAGAQLGPTVGGTPWPVRMQARGGQPHGAINPGNSVDSIVETTSLSANEVAEKEFLFAHRAHVEDVSRVWPYTCWTPKKGMSSPMLTMVSILGGLPVSYTKAVRENRLNFAARRGYRYCELQSMDRHKIPAFTKLPWMLALAPCSDYIIHLDADAQINNMSLSFQPWMDFMAHHNIDQLFSEDCIRQSPINYGVFMIRTAPWIWDFYKKIYNLCVCDWSRMNDWPAEQGVVYDLLAQNLSSPETQRSMIVSGKGWNHILDPGAYPESHDLVVHLTYPGIYPEGHECNNASRFTHECKYVGLEHFLTKVIGTSQHLVEDPSVFFDVANNTCLNVRYNHISGPFTYASYGHRAQSASILDFDVDPVSGRALAVKLSEIGCLGFRETKCELPVLWDKKKGVGPWKAYDKDIPY